MPENNVEVLFVRINPEGTVKDRKLNKGNRVLVISDVTWEDLYADLIAEEWELQPSGAPVIDGLQTMIFHRPIPEIQIKELRPRGFHQS